jgi:predicted dehydrogenase
VVATVPYVYRYYAMVREARIRIQSGLVGRAVLVHGSYLQDWLIDPEETNWRVDPTLGGRSRSFADIGTHWCDLAEFITGDRIQRVRSDLDIVVPTRPDPRGSGPTFSPSPPASSRAGASGLGLSGSGPSGPAVGVTTEDAAVVQFRTEGGALGSVVVSQVAAGHSNHLQLEVLGTDGSLTFDSQRPDQISIGHDGGMTVSRRDPRRLSPEAARYSRLPAGHPQGYQDCVDAFVGETYQAVRSGVVDPLLPTFAVGVRAAAVTDAVLRAAKADGWVTVADLAPATKD